MTLARVRVAWQNWPGAPGVSTFYLDPTPAQAQIDAIRTFFNSFVALLPAGLTITVPSSGDEISESTGNLSGVWSVPTAPATVTAVGTGAYAGNAGAVIHWLTNSLNGKRRLRGRTFVVPLANGSFDNTGAISAATVTSITNAATNLIAANTGTMNVWSRPRPGLSGLQASITSARVPKLSVGLRSRRV